MRAMPEKTATHEPTRKLTCFIAMPITTHEPVAKMYDDEAHWEHVMEHLFVRAIEDAGFEPVRPMTEGSDLIHGRIVKQLSTCDLVLCDLSNHNPNVFFELGVRTSLNLPIALVKDEFTEIPFDTNGINTFQYQSSLKGWNIEEDRKNLAEHIKKSLETCEGENPLWRQFGLTIKANEPDISESPLEAKMDLIVQELNELRERSAVERRMVYEPSEHREAADRSLNLSKSRLLRRYQAETQSMSSVRSVNIEGHELIISVYEESPLADREVQRLRQLADFDNHMNDVGLTLAIRYVPRVVPHRVTTAKSFEEVSEEDESAASRVNAIAMARKSRARPRKDSP